MLSSIIVDHFIDDYKASKTNTRLLNYLRKLPDKTFRTEYTEDEQINCLNLLNRITNIFHNKYDKDLLEEISIEARIDDTELWRDNCYLLSVAHLAKVCTDESTIKLLFDKIVEFLDKLTGYIHNEHYVRGLVETFLFALVNLLPHSNLNIGNIPVDKWLPYTKVQFNNAIQILSSYAIMFLHNRGKATGISHDEIIPIVQYIRDTFDELDKENKNIYRGFIFNDNEISELKRGICKIDAAVRLSADNVEQFMADYKDSKQNPHLSECLRLLDKQNFTTNYTKEEKNLCIVLLREVIDTFLNDNESYVLEVIKNNERQLEQPMEWKFHCYLMSVKFLARVCGRNTLGHLINTVVICLEELCEYRDRNGYARLMIEAYLFAMCNILRRPDATLGVIAAEKWLPYARLDNNDTIKLPSSYIIVFFRNIEKISGIEDEDIIPVLSYVKEKFKEIKRENNKIKKEFNCGEIEVFSLIERVSGNIDEHRRNGPLRE